MSSTVCSTTRRSFRAGLALLALSLLGACRSVERGSPPAGSDADRLLRDISYLADDRLEGRGTGTAGNDSAAAWLSRRHASLGLSAIVTDSTSARCRAIPRPAVCRGYLQRFTAGSAVTALDPHGAHGAQAAGAVTQNVIAVIPGRDPALAGEYVVIGAHYDHLGRSPASAMDRDAGTAIRNGADDNASGTAAALELARLFAAQPARRSVIIAHFSAEELGLLGSQYFVNHSPVLLDRIVAMVNFDMVGRMRGDRLIVYGVGTARELRSLLDSSNVAPRLSISTVADGFGPSDHSSFYGKGIPVLHFFTDLHEDYHRATDDAYKINAAGTARVVSLAERVVRAVGDRPERLTPVRVSGPPAAPAARQGSNVYLGTIPDMASSGTTGLRLSGVRGGSPADKGGLRAGDVVIELGGRAVRDLTSYSEALYAHQPGEDVEIVYLRDGERRTTQATLGTR